jgi:hypothetical protein
LFDGPDVLRRTTLHKGQPHRKARFAEQAKIRTNHELFCCPTAPVLGKTRAIIAAAATRRPLWPLNAGQAQE